MENDGPKETVCEKGKLTPPYMYSTTECLGLHSSLPAGSVVGALKLDMRTRLWGSCSMVGNREACTEARPVERDVLTRI